MHASCRTTGPSFIIRISGYHSCMARRSLLYGVVLLVIYNDIYISKAVMFPIYFHICETHSYHFSGNFVGHKIHPKAYNTESVCLRVVIIPV